MFPRERRTKPTASTRPRKSSNRRTQPFHPPPFAAPRACRRSYVLECATRIARLTAASGTQRPAPSGCSTCAAPGCLEATRRASPEPHPGVEGPSLRLRIASTRSWDAASLPTAKHYPRRSATTQHTWWASPATQRFRCAPSAHGGPSPRCDAFTFTSAGGSGAAHGRAGVGSLRPERRFHQDGRGLQENGAPQAAGREVWCAATH